MSANGDEFWGGGDSDDEEQGRPDVDPFLMAEDEEDTADDGTWAEQEQRRPVEPPQGEQPNSPEQQTSTPRQQTSTPRRQTSNPAQPTSDPEQPGGPEDYLAPEEEEPDEEPPFWPVDPFMYRIQVVPPEPEPPVLPPPDPPPEDTPPKVDPFLFERSFMPRTYVRFFFEMDYEDPEVLHRLPNHLLQHRSARRQVQKLVKEHVRETLKNIDLLHSFYEEEHIPQYFELDGRLYFFSYYFLPPERPVLLPPKSKGERLMENFNKEPEAGSFAFIDIALLIIGFALALTVISCRTDTCEEAGDIGSLIVGFAAFLLACVESYMRFIVAKPPAD